MGIIIRRSILALLLNALLIVVEASLSDLCREQDSWEYGKHLDCTFTEAQLVKSNCAELLTRTDVGRMFLTFSNMTNVSIACVPTSVAHLEINSHHVTDLHVDKSIPKLTRLDLRMYALRRVSDLERLFNLRRLYLYSREALRSVSDDLRALANFTELWISHTELTRSDFDAIPTKTERFFISHSPIKRVPCTFLKSLRYLKAIGISENPRLKTFDTSCLSKNLEHAYLGNNKIRNINLAPFYRFNDTADTSLSLFLHRNRFACTCKFFRQYVRLLRMSKVELQTYRTHRFIRCSSASPLAKYPWMTKHVPTLREHDQKHRRCLTSARRKN